MIWCATSAITDKSGIFDANDVLLTDGTGGVVAVGVGKGVVQ